MSPERVVVLIRTDKLDERVVELCAQLSHEIDVSNLYVVVDETSSDAEDEPRNFPWLPATVLPITRRTLDRLSVDYDGPRTGWKCGDYVLYRALDMPWDHAWVIEPDVYFLNGSEMLLSSAILDQDVDLACVNFNAAGEGWYWRSSFLEWLPGREVYSMAFPIFRASRELVQAAHELRKTIHGSNVDTSVQRPNDESVLASAAGGGGFSVSNLKAGRGDWFDYFSTVVKYHPESLAAIRFKPLVVHSGQSLADLLDYVRRDTSKVFKGDRTTAVRLNAMASTLSKEALKEVFSELVEEVCALARKENGLSEQSIVSSDRLV